MTIRKNYVLWIIITNFIIFFIDIIFSIGRVDLIPSIPGTLIDDLFALTPSIAIKGFYWQFFTYMFLHAGFNHIFWNMFVLMMFGPRIEFEMGSKKFLIFYLICGLGSGLLHIILTGISNTPMVGASGAIFGVLTAFGIMFPHATVFVMGIIPLPARIAVIVFGVLEFFLGIVAPGSSVAHFGHVGGIITSLILLYAFDFKKRKKWYYFWEIA